MTYDDIDTVRLKTQWLQRMGFGGVMFWELSGDSRDEYSLVKAAVTEFAGQTDKTPNHISFPDSVYENVRKGFYE